MRESDTARTTLNRERLRELIDLSPDKAFLEQLVSQFFEDGDRQVRDMREALDGDDCVRFKELAHALRGSAAYLGLRGLELATTSVDQMSVEQVRAQAVGLLDDVERAFYDAKGALDAEVRILRACDEVH